MARVTVEAYAKINLGLAVVRKRGDGYHDIDTIFQSVSLSDTVVLSPAPPDGPPVVLTASGLDVPLDRANLAFRAGELALERFGCPGVAIELTKRIPVAAGLGGGSADAAAVLAGLTVLHGLSAPHGTLAELALELGADVPFMLTGGTARGRGRGELLESLEPLAGVSFVLATPRFGVSAAEAYARARIGLTSDVSFIRVSCSAIREGDVSTLSAELRNDLEAGVVSACPEVLEIEESLTDCGVLSAAMSGSGPTVYGMVRTRAEGESIASRLAGRGWDIHVVEPIEVGHRITRK